MGGGGRRNPSPALSKLDQFVRHHGATPRNTVAMSLAQLNAITTDGQDVRFAGPQTMLAAPLLLAGGFDDAAGSATYGEVYLHTDGSPNSGCAGADRKWSHLAADCGRQGRAWGAANGRVWQQLAPP